MSKLTVIPDPFPSSPVTDNTTVELSVISLQLPFPLTCKVIL